MAHRISKTRKQTNKRQDNTNIRNDALYFYSIQFITQKIYNSADNKLPIQLWGAGAGAGADAFKFIAMFTQSKRIFNTRLNCDRGSK